MDHLDETSEMEIVQCELEEDTRTAQSRSNVWAIIVLCFGIGLIICAVIGFSILIKMMD